MKQQLTYEELQKLDTLPGSEHHRLNVLFAHWMRQRLEVPFALYAACWAAAQGDCPKISALFPLQGSNYIKPNCSTFDFKSYIKDHGRLPGRAPVNQPRARAGYEKQA